MTGNLSLYVVMALAAVALQLGFGGAPLDLLWPGPSGPYAPAADIGLGVGVGLATVLLSRAGSRAFSWSRRIDEEFRTILGPLTSQEIFAMALLSALAEELFFRGFLQPRLGLEVTAIIFGLAHVPYRKHLIPWTIAATGMGWVFGWMFEARGSLVAPFLAHFVVNYFNLHILVRPRATESL